MSDKLVTLNAWLDKIDACDEARAWIASQADRSPRGLITSCPRSDWLLEAGNALGLPREDLASAVQPSVLRALCEHAPAALDAAGLGEHAARLRALPDNVSTKVAVDAAAEAAKAAEASAAVAATWASEASSWASEAASWTAERSSWAAERAAWTASAATWASERASWADAEAARAEAARAENAEHARCADEVRVAIGERLIAALEAQIGGRR
jgi:hypothetical protein